MNEQSLKESNDLLSVIAARTSVGQLLEYSPAFLATEADIKARLPLARAVRALLSRGRLEKDGVNYRLLSAQPLNEDERPKPGRGKSRPSGRTSQPRMNEHSLSQANALLAAIADGRGIGDDRPFLPALFSEQAGIRSSVEVARSVRALASRGRLEKTSDGYRLLDRRPLRADEPPHRRPKVGRGQRGRAERPPTQGHLGRAVVNRLIELNAECAELRVQLERSRSDAEAANREANEAVRGLSAADRRVNTLEAKNQALEQKLSMTEANLKTILDAAKANGGPSEDLQDEKAILEILRGSRREPAG